MRSLLLVLFLASCSTRPLWENNCAGAQELVMESYRIREEKIQNEAHILIGGAVVAPRSIAASFPIPLCEALAQAGGIASHGNPNKITIVRNATSEPKVYEVTWEHVTHLPQESLLLLPGDTVTISKQTLFSWAK